MRSQLIRKSAIVAAVLFGASALTACGAGGSGEGGGGDGDLTIGLLLPDNASSRYENFDRPLFEAAVADLCDTCEVLYSNADGEVSNQLDQANSAIANGADVLVVQAVDSDGSKPVGDAALAADVPVIAYERALNGTEGTSYFASLDGVRTGGLQAAVIIEALEEEGNPTGPVLMVNGSPTDSGARDYEQGATEAFEAAGVEILDSFQTPEWDPAQAQDQVDQWITRYGVDGFEAIYAANGGTAGAASAALQSAGADPEDYFITGQDAELSEIQRIVQGTQYQTIYKPLHELAGVAAEAAVALANGQEPDPEKFSNETDMGTPDPVPTAYVDAISVLQDNIADTVIADEFFTVEEICTSDYAEACSEIGLN